jgi:hypothetical protein
MSRSRQHIARRAFLRGAAGVSIGLPFLLSREGDTRAQAGAAPERLVTVYFAQGMPASARASGLTGVLAPLAPFKDKLTMLAGLECRAQSPNNGHSHGSAGFACGFGTEVLSTKGGPSLDWVVHEHSRTQTPLPTLSAGFSAGDDIAEAVRFHHSWRGKDQPNEVILDTLKLFHAVFGGQGMLPIDEVADPAVLLKARQRVSVLDTVVADYQHVVSDAGGYSPSIRSLISNHLETVRELEQRAVALELSLSGRGPDLAAECREPATAPPQMDSVLGPSVNGLEPKSTPYFKEVWSIMTDLYVLAMRCDWVRFGNLLCGSGGDSYPYECPAGKTANIHAEGFHRWSSDDVRPIVIDHMTWTMTRIAEFLTKLDDPSFKDVDGGTLLDNTTVVIGTELGDDVDNHSLTDMPFWIAGARRRFKSGEFSFPSDRTDVDLYRTILRGVGVEQPFGDQAHFSDFLPILA